MDDTLMEVDYYTYCNKCKYLETECTSDPCNECMDQPYNVNSVKPIKFEEKSR